jgi:hypothetical protein
MKDYRFAAAGDRAHTARFEPMVETVSTGQIHAGDISNSASNPEHQKENVSSPQCARQTVSCRQAIRSKLKPIIMGIAARNNARKRKTSRRMARRK